MDSLSPDAPAFKPIAPFIESAVESIKATDQRAASYYYSYGNEMPLMAIDLAVYANWCVRFWGGAPATPVDPSRLTLRCCAVCSTSCGSTTSLWSRPPCETAWAVSCRFSPPLPDALLPLCVDMSFLRPNQSLSSLLETKRWGALTSLCMSLVQGVRLSNEGVALSERDGCSGRLAPHLKYGSACDLASQSATLPPRVCPPTPCPMRRASFLCGCLCRGLACDGRARGRADEVERRQDGDGGKSY